MVHMNNGTKSLPKQDNKDHFVPQVYLRRFIDKNTNKLHVYDRQEDRWFEAPTKRICYELGWDKLDVNGSDTYLADHLKALEPNIGPFLQGLKREKISDHDRYYFATWLAILFAMSPTRKEYDYLSLQLLGQNVDPNSQDLNFALKKRNLQQARQIGMLLYAYDWHLTYNFTDTPFITCDFPAHYLCLNDTVPPLYQPLGFVLDPQTFLRISPKLVVQPEVYQPGFSDFTKVQPGQMSYGKISKFWKYAQRTISRINEPAIFNANRFVISSYLDDGLKQFVKNRRNSTTKFQPIVTQTQNGPVIQTRLVNNFENVPLRLPKNLKI